MLQRIVTCALLAGLVAGLFTTVLQLSFVTPLVLKGEVYEHRAEHAEGVGHAHDHASAATSGELKHEDWAPADGTERAGFTALATVVSMIGFALMLVAAAVLSPGGLTLGKGIAVGLVGFAATGLAPSLGLPPELPGSAADNLINRQVWWIATAASAAAGIALIAYARPPLKAAGLALLAAPHLIGAPDVGSFGSTAPAELSARFSANALVVQAIMWTVLGSACGWFWTWLESSRSLRRQAWSH